MAENRLQRLSELGQSVWIDYLSRPFVREGGLTRLMEEDAVVGVTSNPTIFQSAIAEGDAYDEQMREVIANESDDTEEIFLAARHATTSATPATSCAPSGTRGSGKDGWVSLEVDPNLAHDTEGTIAEAKRLHELVDSPNLLIKIPATERGPARDRGDRSPRGIPVNVTLIFSLERHREVAEAYVRGLERLVERRRRPVDASPRSPRSSSRASTPRPTSASTRSAATTSSRARSRSPTPSSPTRPTRRSSPATAGRRWRPRAPRRSAACGRRRRPRTRTTATCSTSRS